ncbi:MAG: hypothetical protein R2911_15735 [Caldilineaceae bacterium]
MYLGRVVERAPVQEIFRNPQHPYTRALLTSIPTIDAQPRQRLPTISGSIPHPQNRPPGCPFHPRCPDYMAGTCEQKEPQLAAVGTTMKLVASYIRVAEFDCSTSFQLVQCEGLACPTSSNRF